MMISEDRIEEFCRVYKTAFGEETSIAEARQMANQLVALYTLLMQPVPDWREESGGPESWTQNAPEEF
jgi:hypothetical protein